MCLLVMLSDPLIILASNLRELLINECALVDRMQVIVHCTTAACCVSGILKLQPKLYSGAKVVQWLSVATLMK